MNPTWSAIFQGVAVQLGETARDQLVATIQEIREERGDWVLVVETPAERDWVTKRYLDLLTRELRVRSAAPVDVQIKLKNQAPLESTRTSPAALRTNAGINSRYTFDTFVVGGSNEMAASAAQGVAARPGEAYNPLFLHGGVGLGKTHLLHAMGNEILRQYPEARIVYRSCEQFINEFVQAIGERKMDEFRSRYRNQADVLLVDDIQFLAGKEATQEEFFHTFEVLKNSGRQICITSDRPPKDIQNLADRLRSRFSWGLNVDIQPPGLETRIAIILKKARFDGLELPQDVAEFLADSFRGNIRDMEGCLNRLGAFASFSRSPITLDFAKEVLKDQLPDRRQPTADDIIRGVAEYYQLKVADLTSRRRHRSIARPRQVAMYICRHTLGKSFPDIGRDFGKDHSTVISACRKIDQLILEDAVTRTAVDVLQRRFQEN